MIRLRLDINIGYPMVQIETTQPRWQMERHDGRLEIQTEGPELRMDFRAAWEDLGYGDYRYIMSRGVDRGRQAVLDRITKYAQDGQQYMDEMDQATLSRMVLREQRTEQQRTINVRSAPRSRPEIEVLFDFQIHGEPGYVAMEYQGTPPNIQAQMGYVQIQAVPEPGGQLDLRG